MAWIQRRKRLDEQDTLDSRQDGEQIKDVRTNSLQGPAIAGFSFFCA
jgi:hypothetical protein